MGSWVAARKHPPLIGGHYHLGQPLPGREVRIAECGEILVRGKTLFQGYWENGKIEKPDDWFATGDIGRFDPNEGLAVVGRKDWQFISGGENIQPEEIEQHLAQIPEVIEAAVVPQNDPEFGQRPAAFVRTSDGAFNLSRLRNALEGRLPKYKIPVSLFLLNEMPKNGLKTNRKALFEIANGKN
jgi:O-succinylbenzoic acid--CoA ligase